MRAATTFALVFATLAAAAAEGGARTIVDLQPFKQATSGAAELPGGEGVATLINLNPRINTWYVLELRPAGGGEPAFYHLENPAPLHQTLVLAPNGRGLVVRTEIHEFACDLWAGPHASELDRARASRESYAPLCEAKIYLRNATAGYRTARELVTEFLRDRVWGGEALIDAVKETVERDAHLERSPGRPQPDDEELGPRTDGPRPAAVAAEERGLRPRPAGLGIELDLAAPDKLAFGEWYAAKGVDDVYASVMLPGIAPAELLASHSDRVRPLDAVEAGALVYLVAFDLARLRLGYEVGTDHPRVGWSDRVLPQVRDPELPGPDGFDTIAPLAATGLVDPAHVSRAVAAFTGGFKRSHGAFHSGELARINRGSHYGFIEYGVVFSTLEPALATLVIRDTGRLDMQTWQGADPRSLVGIEHARQNGVPLVEPDSATGEPVPGRWVGNWSLGNWSGSAAGEQRTVRSGVCLQESAAGRFLLYGYFSSVTPSAMARVFQAYGCGYAMQLDMNALEHTYLALYGPGESAVRVQHLVRGMEAVDRPANGTTIPRFIGYPDNRDFFYVLRRQEDEP